MGDSEDEYDRKRRDKFRGERAEASYRGAERTVRPRDDWQDRESWSRPRPRDYRGPVRDRGYSPSMEPPPKRYRQDFYGADNYYNHYQPYHPPPHREPPLPIEGQTPAMMTFKAFLATQDDNISDSEAIEKYNDYKLEFQRQQLNEFFVAHKDEEWFRLKYHPEESVKRKEEQLNFLKKRVDVFMELMNSGKLDDISVDYTKTDDLIRLLDTAVIKLEGGTDADLAVLDQEAQECTEVVLTEKQTEIGKDVAKSDNDATKTNTAVSNNWNDDSQKEEPSSQADPDEPKDEPSTISEQVGEGEEEGEAEEEKKLEDGEEEEEPRPPGEEDPIPELQNGEKKDDENNKKPSKKRKRSYSGSGSSSSSSSDSESEGEEKEKKEKSDEDEKPKEEEEEEEPKEEIKKEIKEEKKEDKPEPPRALHKTTSIFLRNLAPTITRQEIEALCSRYSGFLRVALADPLPDRRWMRRGWVTFTRNANIKEICWNLNNIRLRDCELGAIVNRDLSRRIRQTNGITAHKPVVRSDIRISAKVTLHLDRKSGLWIDEENKEDKSDTFGFMSKNPVLHNITDYLIEEASAEEEELLGLQSSSEETNTATVERDETLIRVLDRIVLYLRIVHSIDYYNHCEYPNEDEMPNRCGILHARGPPPVTTTDITSFVGAAVESKMSQFLPEKVSQEDNKNESKLLALALKDVDMEIDKFVQANTRELAKDKWLCPLSGKKFKGPDFVRKHIFNKHAEKIEEVKKEVEFFNNFLKDPKRPMVPIDTPARREEPPAFQATHYGGGGFGGFNGPPRYYNQNPTFMPRPRAFPPRGRFDYRPIIHYRDLDAPREPEEFI